MKRLTLLVPALALLLLAGCTIPFLSGADAADEEDTLTIYRVSAAESGEIQDLIGQETLAVPADAASELDAAMTLFASPSGNRSLACALPDGVSVESWSLENGVVTLAFSESFLDLGDMDRTVSAFCAVLTLCQLDEVESVTVTVGDETLFSRLTEDDALLRDTDTDPYVRRLRLYFADGDGRYLISEYHSLTLDEDADPERYVIEELLRGPHNGELQSALPEGTELLSCQTEDRVCTVDFSAEFYSARPQTALGERLAVYSVVNSLTALPQVDSVIILVEGQPVDTYVYLSLSEPLSWYDDPIGPVDTARGELDADLYLTLPGMEAVAALPCRVDASEYQSQAEAVLNALLSHAEPGYPTLFSGSGTVTGVSVKGTFCTVDLSESFFASLPEQARTEAVQSIAATLCALENITAVYFTIGGEQALFDGQDWSGPWQFSDVDTIVP